MIAFMLCLLALGSAALALRRLVEAVRDTLAALPRDNQAWCWY